MGLYLASSIESTNELNNTFLFFSITTQSYRPRSKASEGYVFTGNMSERGSNKIWLWGTRVGCLHTHTHVLQTRLVTFCWEVWHQMPHWIGHMIWGWSSPVGGIFIPQMSTLPQMSTPYIRELQSMCGWHASYWNAFFLVMLSLLKRFFNEEQKLNNAEIFLQIVQSLFIILVVDPGFSIEDKNVLSMWICA